MKFYQKVFNIWLRIDTDSVSFHSTLNSVVGRLLSVAIPHQIYLVKIASYNCALNPTKNVSPTFNVGARRLPLRPMTAASISSCEPSVGSNTSTLLPFATWTDSAVSRRSHTAPESNFSLPASVRLFTSIPCASRNSCAFRQEFQFFLKYIQLTVIGFLH